MPCKKCKDGKYKWGNTGECKYATKDECEKANPKKYSDMKNTPTPLGKKTYAEYEKELKEFNLSKVEKVELSNIQLSLTDDAKQLVKAGKSLQKVMVSTYKPFPKLEADFGKIYERIQEFIKKADDLPKEAEAIQKKSLDLYRKLEKSADSLGVNITDIPVAKQLDEISSDLEDNITQIKNALRDAKAV